MDALTLNTNLMKYYVSPIWVSNQVLEEAVTTSKRRNENQNLWAQNGHALWLQYWQPQLQELQVRFLANGTRNRRPENMGPSSV